MIAAAAVLAWIRSATPNSGLRRSVLAAARSDARYRAASIGLRLRVPPTGSLGSRCSTVTPRPASPPNASPLGGQQSMAVQGGSVVRSRANASSAPPLCPV